MSSSFDCTEGEKRFLAICVAARRSAMREVLSDAMSAEEVAMFREALTLAEGLYTRLMSSARRDERGRVTEARSAQ
jgi:hypothetical protein